MLRIVSGQAADGPFHTVEQLAARYSFQLHGADGSSEVDETLQELRALEDDWDGYGALAPISPALERAWHLASMLVEEGLPLPQVFPTRKGGLQLEWHAPHASLEWELDSNGFTGLFIFDDHRTGATLDGELPGAEDLLVAELDRRCR